MKFRLTYGYVYACIATVADRIEEIHEKCQNIYVEAKLEPWRKKVAENLKEFYPIIVKADSEHTIDVEALDRSIKVIKYLTSEDISIIKDIGVPELDAMGESIRNFIINNTDKITKPRVGSNSIPWVDSKTNAGTGGNIPWN